MDEHNPNASGPSRTAVEQELSNSLERLGMETVDLYQTHRWDDDTPIVGVSSVEHLEDAVVALDISLSDSDVEYPEEPYEPVEVAGHE